MAITRAQIARELYIKGGVVNPDGRRGFFAGAEKDSRETGSNISPGTVGGGPNIGGVRDDNPFTGGGDGPEGPPSIINKPPVKVPPVKVPPPKPKKTKENTLPTLNAVDRFKVFNLKKLYEKKMGLTPNVYGVVPNLLQAVTPTKLNFYEESEDDNDMSYYGMTGDDITDADRLAEAINEAEKTGNITQTEFENAFYGSDGPPQIVGGGGDNQVTDPCKGPNPPAYCFVGNDTEEDTTVPRNLGGLAPRFAGSIFDFTGLADGGRAGYMDGGMMDDTPEGGIMDLESGRQMYFLGKLVKKATRAVKKVAKSPLGKAALLGLGAGMAGFGPASGLFGSGKGLAFKQFLMGSVKPGGMGNKTGGLFNFIKDNPYKSIFGGSALLGLMGQKEEEDGFDIDEYYKTQGIDIDAIRNNPNRILARRFMAEGGDAEPVAKKTMPLLDMDGKEMDLREEGGFVPLGRMERADDVPARLSKNEFVFTADAVRNAGEGDIDKGAEVMYNMMKNLESGGEVSEESQGLDGAREMFQTSQRLKEVL